MFGEDAGGDPADVLLPDTVVVDLRPQAWHGEDMDVSQVGKARQAVLGVILARGTSKVDQRHPPNSAALVGCKLELGFGTDFGQGEHLGGGGGL